MAHEYDQVMTLADGREVTVFYQIDDYGSDPSGMSGPPEDYDPGSGPELHIVSVHEGDEADAPEIHISDEERYRLEDIIAENPDWWMPDYDGPDDY